MRTKRVEIKSIGICPGDTEYKKNIWDTSTMISVMFFNKLNTKKQIIDYLSDIRIHEDSIENFMDLLSDTKKQLKERELERTRQKNKNKKIVERYLK